MPAIFTQMLQVLSSGPCGLLIGLIGLSTCTVETWRVGVSWKKFATEQEKYVQCKNTMPVQKVEWHVARWKICLMLEFLSDYK